MIVISLVEKCFDFVTFLARPPKIPFVAQLSPPTPIPSLDLKACIICQKITNEPFAKKIDRKKIERIVSSLSDHNWLKTGKYKISHTRLKHRTIQELLICKYHNSCSRQLSRDEKYILRAQKAHQPSGQKTNDVNCKPDRISRSSMSFFEEVKCFFCQNDTPELTHLVSQFSKSDDWKPLLKILQLH